VGLFQFETKPSKKSAEVTELMPDSRSYSLSDHLRWQGVLLGAEAA
jgi:hypothetical protein